MDANIFPFLLRIKWLVINWANSRQPVPSVVIPKRIRKPNVYLLFVALVMGQKTHPIGLRLGITQPHRARWYASPAHYSYLVFEDHQLRQYLRNARRAAGISTVEIERRGNALRLRVSAAQVRPLIGADGRALETLRKELTRECIRLRTQFQKQNGVPRGQSSSGTTPISLQPEVQLFVRQTPNVQRDAGYLADLVVRELEKRTAFRRALRVAMERAQTAGVRGIRIQVSGRLNGAEIARTEWMRQGRVPLHTLSADLDYTCKTARTIYGLLGVKVWVFRPLPALAEPVRFPLPAEPTVGLFALALPLSSVFPSFFFFFAFRYA